VDPCDADAIAVPNRRDRASPLHDTTDDLVSRDDRIPRGAETALGDIEVRPAHAADIHSDQYFVRAGLRRRYVCQSKYPAPLDGGHRSVEEHCLHHSRRWAMGDGKA
jgi:hypothetical protein